MISERSAAHLRRGILTIFVTDGGLFASWSSRLPEVQESLHGSTAVLGLALAGIAVGALVAMPLTGLICRTHRPHRVACAALLLLCLSLTLPGLTTTPWMLGLVLVVFGACYGATDVAMNSAAVELATAIRKPIVPAFHAGFSVGALTGAGLGSLAAGAGLSVPVHLSIACAAGLIALVVTNGRLALRPNSDRPDPATPAPPRGSDSASSRHRRSREAGKALATAGILTTTAAFAEGVTAGWSGIYLVKVAGAPLWVAPLAYALMMMTQAIVRAAGPRLLTAYGVRRVALAGTALAAAGLLVALVPTVPVSLIGFAVAGIGLGCVFPIGIAHAGAAAGSIGVSIASTSGYAGFLVGPPVIGLLAAAMPLPVALALMAASQGAAVAAARNLPRHVGRLDNSAE